jgi:glycerol kinase
MSFVLAIDQSTSATKAVLFDLNGAMVDRASREHRQIYPRPGWVEHDAEEIWQNLLATVKELAARQHEKLSQLVCLSLANQRETFVVFDPKSGRPLYPAIVWQCRRGDPVCAQLRPSGESLVRAKTGLALDSYFSAPKLKWIMEQEPELAAKLRAGRAVVGTMDSYLVHRLTEGKCFVTDATNASRTLLYDVAKLRWDGQLCELFGVPQQALPEVAESAAVMGETDIAGVLPQRVPVCGIMGDSQAALFAHRCFSRGMAKVTFGTGSSILLNIGEDFRLSERGPLTALAWLWRDKPSYALEALINFSAATIKWLQTQLGLIGEPAQAAALASSVEDNGGVYFVPAFAGLNPPHSAPQARAAIVGMSAFTRREHIVRAAEEAIAYQIHDALGMMSADSHVTLENLQADGGPTRDAFLMQFTADITQKVLHVAQTAELSAWGAAMAGLLGVGHFRSLDDLAALPRPTRAYTPSKTAAHAQALHQGWLAAVRRTL